MSRCQSPHLLGHYPTPLGTRLNQGAVAATRDFPGLVGIFSFNEERLPVKELMWVEVRNGDWALFESP